MEIINLSAKNYRSLRDVSIVGFQATTIFFGENNAGKSNILSLLYLIFKRKPKLTSSGLSLVENFYSGVILDPGNNYFNNDIDHAIEFEVDVECMTSELNVDPLVSSLFKGQDRIVFRFIGAIKPQVPFEFSYSDFNIEQVLVGSKLIYSSNESGFSYFPTIDKGGKRSSDFSRAFTSLIDLFNDCVDIVGSQRDMLETDIGYEEIDLLNPHTFKKFLYNLYLSRKKHKIFDEIDKLFSSPPFGYGRISFSNENSRLEIEVKERNFRLPIKSLGSGVLQALYIITSIVCSKSSIICIEELEQNLSPTKQEEILEKLKSMIGGSTRLTQLILSSHSIMYSEPKFGAIYFVEKTGEGETIVNKKETNKLSRKMTSHFKPARSRSAYTGSQPS